MDIEKTLNNLIKVEKEKTFNQIGISTNFALIEMVRSLDTAYTIEPSINYKKDFGDFFDVYKYGYHYILQHLLKNIKYSGGFPVYSYSNELHTWSNSLLYHFGKIGITEQLLFYLRADLVNISINAKEFIIKFKENLGFLEFTENLSLKWYYSIIEDINKGEIEKNEQQKNKVLEEIFNNVSLWKDFPGFISYNSTPLIDEYFSKRAYFNTVQTQLFDHLPEDSVFGGIKYKEYCDVVQEIMSVCLKHTYFCLQAIKKFQQLNLQSLLSLPIILDETVKSFSEYLEIDSDKILQIINCLILNKENCLEHLKHSKSPVPPFIKVSDTHLLRSVMGGTFKPYHFLRDELKRRYPTDYFNSQNEKENIFRTQLYNLFEIEKLTGKPYGGRLIKVKNCCRIKSNKLITDIDAVIFDREKKTLGLFQLKWPDDFEDSMRARFSKITNTVQKANEWVGKVFEWISKNDQEFILKHLGLFEKSYQGNLINSVLIFVINRYNSHFTNVELNSKAVWSSWYHLLEVKGKFASDFDDPIREVYTSLMVDSPYHPLEKEKPSLQDFTYHLNNYTFNFINQN